jgi:hypothetical protein
VPVCCQFADPRSSSAENQVGQFADPRAATAENQGIQFADTGSPAAENEAGSRFADPRTTAAKNQTCGYRLTSFSLVTGRDAVKLSAISVNLNWTGGRR